LLLLFVFFVLKDQSVWAPVTKVINLREAHLPGYLQWGWGGWCPSANRCSNYQWLHDGSTNTNYLWV